MGVTKNIIVVIGELLWDVLPDKTILGGAPTNLAYRLNEMEEIPCLISRIGNDILGEKAKAKINELDLDTSLIQVDESYPTGTVQVSFDDSRNPTYLIVPNVAYDYIEFNSSIQSIAEKANLIAFGTLSQRSPKTRTTVRKILNISSKAIKFLDINLRKACYNFEIISQSLRYADILKINHHELFELRSILNLLCEDIPSLAKEISDKNKIQTVLVTLEEKGVFFFDRLEGNHYVPGIKINLEDPLGAGDAFSAAFIYNFLRKKSLIESCIEGNKMGALVATQKGATQEITGKEMSNIAFNNKRVCDSSLMKYYNQD